MKFYTLYDFDGCCLGRGTLEAIKRCYGRELARIDRKTRTAYLCISMGWK